MILLLFDILCVYYCVCVPMPYTLLFIIVDDVEIHFVVDTAVTLYSP